MTTDHSAIWRYDRTTPERCNTQPSIKNDEEGEEGEGEGEGKRKEREREREKKRKRKTKKKKKKRGYVSSGVSVPLNEGCRMTSIPVRFAAGVSLRRGIRGRRRRKSIRTRRRRGTGRDRVRIAGGWRVELPQFMSTDAHFFLVKIGLEFQSLCKISNISTSDSQVLLGQFQHWEREMQRQRERKREREKEGEQEEGEKEKEKEEEEEEEEEEEQEQEQEQEEQQQQEGRGRVSVEAFPTSI